MPSSFKHVIESSIGTTPVDILECPINFRLTVIGFNLVNITEYDNALVDVWITDGSSAQAYYVKGAVIPPNTSLKIITNGEKLILPEGAGLRIVSDIADSIDVTISYVELS